MNEEETSEAGGIEMPRKEKKNKKNKKGKKRRYSKELSDAQKLDRVFTKNQRRVARAVLDAIDSWDRSSRRSAGKRKDGAVRDAWTNSSKAYAKYYKGLKNVPSGFDALYSDKGWPKPFKLLNDLLPY